MKKIIYSLWASATVFGLVGACGGDSSDPATNPATTSPSTTSPGTVTGTGGTTGIGSTTGAVTGTVTGTTGAVSDCTLLEYAGVETAMAQVPASTGVYSYGDGVTTACITAPTPNNVCLDGLGADAGPDYANYGAGIGIKLATDDTTGWDATAAGVVGVKFTLAGVSAAAPVRVGVTLVGLTNNGFVGLNEAGYTMVGEQTVLFADMKQPSWSSLEDLFDATMIHSLQFQVVTAQDVTRPFNFCVSGITWIDAAGNAVDIPWTTGGGEGGAGGEGPDTTSTTGTSSATTGSSTTGTSSATTGSSTTGTSSATTGSSTTSGTTSTTGTSSTTSP